jgi:hypothetical protein
LPTDTAAERHALEEESEQAHHVMGQLRMLVGRYAFGEVNDVSEVDDVLRQADAWIKAWRERRMTPAHASGDRGGR